MAVTRSIMLTVILAAQGLTAGSLGGSKKNIDPGAPAVANMLLRLAHPIQARQAPSMAAAPSSFSSTAIQVPIATVCPLNGSTESSAAFEPLSLPTFGLSDVTDSIVSASAVMPDGSMTTFASRARRQDAAVGTQLAAALTLPGGTTAMPLLGEQPDAARLVVGSDGCQTLFSPTTMAICSTVVSPAGLPPVTITDCDQYVTFSSETVFTCSQTPTYSPRPYSTISENNETVTLGDDTFTTRPFPTSSTSTIGEDSNDEMTSITSSDASTVSDFASVDGGDEEGDDEDEDNDMERRDILKRQLMFSRSKNAPVLTDLETVAPTPSIIPEKRQVMFDRDGNKPVMTDLDTISPASSPMPEKRQVLFNHAGNRLVKTDLETVAPTESPMPRKRQLLFDHKNNRPAMTDLETVAPVLAPGYVRAPLMVSGYTTGAPTHTANQTTDSSLAAAAAVAATKILPIPPMLQAKYNREHVGMHYHPRQLDEEDLGMDMSEMPTTPLPSQRNSTMALNGTNSTLSLENKLALVSAPQPTKYYAAPWVEVAAGGVPTHVKGMTCYGGLPPAGECTTPDSDGDTEGCECSVQDEVWSVSTLSATRVGTTVASFDGDVIVTGGGGMMTTTSISFVSTLTTTRVDVVESIVRRTLGPGESFEPTVTIEQTSIPSAVVTLLPGDASGDVNIKAGMPQDAPASITTTPEAEMSILPYYESTTTDGYYGSATTIPNESMGQASLVADAANLPSTTVDITSVSTPTGVDDLPTTLLETSIVATETVTVQGTTLPTDAVATPAGVLPQGTVALAAAKEKRDDVWPSDVWLAHLDSASSDQDVEVEAEMGKRDDVWPSDVWLAHLEAIKPRPGSNPTTTATSSTLATTSPGLSLDDVDEGRIFSLAPLDFPEPNDDAMRL